MRDLLQDDLARFEILLREQLASSVAFIEAIGDDLARAGGKRLRPLLSFLAGRLLGADPEQTMRVALAVELLHSASLLHDDLRWELSEYLGEGTNNIGELMGILRACEQSPDPSRPLRIYTDSTYSIGVLQKGWKAKANVSLVAACKAALARLDDVTLHYVKGHAGIPLNEVADSLAVTAVERRSSRPWTKVSGS